MLFLDTCADLAPIIKLIKNGVLPAIYIVIGVLILVLVIIDIAKAIIAVKAACVSLVAASSAALARGVVSSGCSLFFLRLKLRESCSSKSLSLPSCFFFTGFSLLS